MGKKKIHHGVENTVTLEDLRHLTVKDIVLPESQSVPDPEDFTTLMLVDEVTDTTIKFDGPMMVRFYADNVDGQLELGFNLELYSVRKYDLSIIDIEMYHDAVGEVALSRGFNRGIGHDLPAHYNTIVAGALDNPNPNDSLYDIGLKLQQIAMSIHDEAEELAVTRHIAALRNIQLAHKNKKHG